MKIEIQQRKIQEYTQKIEALKNMKCRNPKEVFEDHKMIFENMRKFCKNCGLNQSEIN